MKDKWKWTQSADGTTLSSLPFDAATTSMQLCHANEAYKAFTASNPPSLPLSLSHFIAQLMRERSKFMKTFAVCVGTTTTTMSWFKLGRSKRAVSERGRGASFAARETAIDMHLSVTACMHLPNLPTGCRGARILKMNLVV